MYLIYITTVSNGNTLLEIYDGTEKVFEEFKLFNKKNKEENYISALEYLLDVFPFAAAQELTFYTTKEIAQAANSAFYKQACGRWAKVVRKFSAFNYPPVFFSGSKRTKEITKKLKSNIIILQEV